MKQKGELLLRKIIDDGLDPSEFVKLLVSVRDNEDILQKNMRSTYGSNVSVILMTSLRFQVLIRLFKKYINYFDFSVLHRLEQVMLLCADWDVFHRHIDMKSFSTALRVEVVCANPSVFNELLGDIKLSAGQASLLLMAVPEVVEDMKSVPYGRIDITAWGSLLMYDYDTYSAQMKKELIKMRDKTKVRRMLQMTSDMFSGISISILQNSALSEKEWVLLAYDLKEKFSKTVVAWLDKEITLQVIAGTFKTSEPLRRALNYAKAS